MMMASSIKCQSFICHFCFDEFQTRSSLVSHFPECHKKKSTRLHEQTTSLPRLNKLDRDILHMLKLHRCNDKFPSNKSKHKINSYLQIPITITHTSYKNQASFDDSICNTGNTILINSNEENNSIHTLHIKSSSSCHLYKYSRREQKNFYASVKRARLKKQYSSLKRSYKNSLIFNKEKFSINLPTKINSRQRLNTNTNNSYPLIFDPNFHSLVQLSTNNLFLNYFNDINIYFHLLHSIASQEFQIIINSNDQQHHVSYTAYSFLNILRQAMTDYSLNLQQSLKRNYFQAFQINNQQTTTTTTPPPFKIRRYDQQSIASSNFQIDDNYQRFETSINNNLTSEIIINNFIPNETIIHPVRSDVILRPRQPSRDRTSSQPPIQTSFIPIVEEQPINPCPSPILLKKQKLEPIQIDESGVPLERACIRIINGTDHNKKRSSSNKRISKSNHPIDENSMIKTTRMNTRKSPIKTEIITEMNPSFETKPVILSSNEFSKGWTTHNVFYRCHACSHEEFFVVLSRECMNLHVSSKHANMEENFKQRLSNFLNKKGRSLKIFQHYLKWQQPWSEKQIEQLFKLSNNA